MKRKIISFISLTLLLISVSTFLFACIATPGTLKAKIESSSEDQIVISVSDVDGKATVFDALQYLIDNGKITCEYTESEYGAYITSINGKKESVTSTSNSSEGYSWMLYTTDKENSYEADTITVLDRVCGSSSVGVSSLIAKEGELYVLIYKHFSYTW